MKNFRISRCAVRLVAASLGVGIPAWADEPKNSEFIESAVSRFNAEVDAAGDDAKKNEAAILRVVSAINMANFATVTCIQWRDTDLVFAQQFKLRLAKALWSRADQYAIQRAEVYFSKWAAGHLQYVAESSAPFLGPPARELCYDAYYPGGLAEHLFVGARWPQGSLNGR
jgi:hypothetical protein